MNRRTDIKSIRINITSSTRPGLMVDDVIKFVSDKSSSIEAELVKHKVDDVVTIDKKRDNNNDIQRSEEEDNKQQQQSTTNTVF